MVWVLYAAGDGLCQGWWCEGDRPRGLAVTVDVPDWTANPVGPVAAEATAVTGSGLDFSYTFPNNGQLLVVRAPLFTSSTAGTRWPVFRIFNTAEAVVWEMPAFAGQVASKSIQYILALGMPYAQVPDGAGNLYAYCPLPSGLVVGQGWSFTTLTNGLKSDDEWLPTLITTNN